MVAQDQQQGFGEVKSCSRAASSIMVPLSSTREQINPQALKFNLIDKLLLLFDMFQMSYLLIFVPRSPCTAVLIQSGLSWSLVCI